jgi:hypothetical protein
MFGQIGQLRQHRGTEKPKPGNAQYRIKEGWFLTHQTH